MSIYAYAVGMVNARQKSCQIKIKKMLDIKNTLCYNISGALMTSSLYHKKGNVNTFFCFFRTDPCHFSVKDISYGYQ